MRRARLLIHSGRMLRRYPMRSAFVALGTLVGVAALTLVVSVGEAASRRLLATVHQLFGGSSIVVVAGGSNFMGGPRPETARLTVDDIEAVVQEVPGIETWDPEQVVPAASVRHDDRTTTARVLGQSERSRTAWNRGVSRGEYFDAQAVASSARVALIGATAAERLFGREDPMGADVLVGNVPFRVTGVLERLGTDIHGMDRDNELVVPITTLQRRVMNVDTILLAKLVAFDPAAVDATAEAARRVLRDRHGLTGDRPDDFTMMTATEVRQMVGLVRRVLFVYLPLVAAVTLVASGFVAALLMLSSVTERVSEIGLRGAVGALPSDIRLQFVAETALTTTAGGLAGALVGYGGAVVAAAHLKLGTVYSWRAVSAGIAVSAVVGVIAGVAPARRAARLPPADALR